MQKGFRQSLEALYRRSQRDSALPLVFRRFFGVSDCRVPRWVPYVAFSLASVQAPAHGVSRAVNPLHFYPHCSFSAGGGGTPALGRAFLRAAGHLAKRWPCPLFLFHVFFTFYFLIFHFSITLVGLCLIPTFLHVFRNCATLRHADGFGDLKMAIFQRFLVWAIPVYCLESLEFQRFALSTLFVWTIPVYAILTKGNSVGVCHMLS